MSLLVRLTLIAAAGLLLAACGSRATPSYFLSHHPDDTRSRQLRLYPVARQGNLTAWLTSDHVIPSGDWLYAPGDPSPRCPVVGVIRASAMPEGAKHDGAFLIASGYDGPLFALWQGTDADARLFTGSGGWIPVLIHQDESIVNAWVKSPARRPIGGWSGFPVVIGEPDHPEAVAGAMWYKSNTEPNLGGATSTRMLQRWLDRLKFEDFVKRRE